MHVVLTSVVRPSRLYRGYIFDLDGTTYLDDALLPGVAATIRALRKAQCQVVFVSNNPTHTRAAMAARLTRLGLATRTGEVVNSTMVLIDYLCRRAPGCRVFPVAEQPVCDELRAAGFILSEDPQAIDFVIASFDRTFVYRKLQIAFDAIRAGAQLIATNADRFCPVAGGGQPDAAAIIAAIEACTGTQVEEIVGKPSPLMAAAALKVLGLAPGDCLMAGDRLETDIAMGCQAGMATALVLTGATPTAALTDSPVTPDFVLESLDQLLPEEAPTRD